MADEIEVVEHRPKGQIHGPTCECLQCPYCGATEVDDCRKPGSEWKWQIRAFKIDNSSHCLICDNWFEVPGS
jgi:hypothetical protein